MQSLRSALAGRGILLVTHRLTDLEDMDEIIVLEHGRVIERGRQSELLAQNGLFAAMWKLQNRVIFDADGTFSDWLAS